MHISHPHRPPCACLARTAQVFLAHLRSPLTLPVELEGDNLTLLELLSSSLFGDLLWRARLLPTIVHDAIFSPNAFHHSYCLSPWQSSHRRHTAWQNTACISLRIMRSGLHSWAFKPGGATRYWKTIRIFAQVNISRAYVSWKIFIFKSKWLLQTKEPRENDYLDSSKLTWSPLGPAVGLAWMDFQF